MNAEEMFKEMGYIKESEGDFKIIYCKVTSTFDFIIKDILEFFPKSKELDMYSQEETKNGSYKRQVPFTMDDFSLLRAIEQQIKEFK